MFRLKNWPFGTVFSVPSRIQEETDGVVAAERIARILKVGVELGSSGPEGLDLDLPWWWMLIWILDR